MVVATLALRPHLPPGQRPLMLYAALFDASVSTALFVWLATPRAERRLHGAVQTAARGALLMALLFPVLRQSVWVGARGVGAAAYFALRGLRQPLPEGYAELDDLERRYAAYARLFPDSRLGRALLFDRALWVHPLRRPRLPEGQHFATRQGAGTGSTLVLLVFLTVMESLPVHFILVQRSHNAALVHLGANLLGVALVVAYGRALGTRPVTVGRRRLYLRSGLHWTASTPRVNVAEARPVSPEDAGLHSLAVGTRPTSP